MSTLARNRVRIAVAACVVAAALTVAAAPAPTTRSVAAQSSTDPRSVTPVFVLDQGRFTMFDIPFGEFGGDAVAINDRRQIVGSYYPDSTATCVRGFQRDPNGRFSRIDFTSPGATNLFDVNDRGQMVGNFRASPCSDAEPLRGFVRDERGRFTTIQVPGARQVQALGINNRGQVVGDYLDAQGNNHGYVWEAGRLTNVDGPAGAKAVTVLDLNDNAQMVGVYSDPAGTQHAFALRNGRYTTIDAPGVRFTIPFGINNRGQVAGLTAASLPLTETSDAHGFLLRDGAGGPFTGIDVPGAVFGTAAFDINDTGVVVGVYGNPNATNPPSAGGRSLAGMQSLGRTGTSS